MKCPKCQHENPEDSTFCGKCATRLGKEAQPSFTKTIETSQEELTSGTRLSGRYQIIEELGQGGMGKVYRAEDTSLSRPVAIKILPEEFAIDPERLARFEREAKLLAVLSHPNIAAIHGIEESGGRRFLILELAEGETLRDRLERGPLSVDEALETCRQIAEGLEAAHEKGIIHRDLKPGNIMISVEGKVKILDFGLAKAYSVETTGVDVKKSPTITAEMTRPGIVLGTAAYMSPEQAKGRAADKRTDIWAFGCILFECLTGRRAFEGETTSEIIASILKGEPEWTDLPPQVHPVVRALLRRCLRKDKDRRQHDISDARIEIEDVLSEKHIVSPTISVREGSRRVLISWRAMGLSILLTAISVGIITWSLLRTESSNPSRRFIDIPSSEAPLASGLGTDVAISPNGRRLIYVASVKASTQLYTRLMSEYEFVPLIGTENARMPFFSLDGEWLGYYSDSNQKLMKMPLSSGKPVPLGICNATSVFSAYWGSDDYIYFGSLRGFGIRRVSAKGGEPEVITTPNSGANEIAHDSPVLLPDGNTLLYVIRKGEGQEESVIVAHDLKTGKRKTLIEGSVNIQYVQSGYLAYNRAGTLLVAPFSLKKLEIGEWLPIVDDIKASGYLAAEFALSKEGTLVYVSGPTRSKKYLAWINDQGIEISLGDMRDQFEQAKISPLGRSVAIDIWDNVNRTYNIWIYDIQSRVNEQITYVGNNASFAWSPDGKSIAYVSSSEGTDAIYLQSLEGDRKTEKLWTSNNELLLSSWSPDGKWLAFTSNASGNWDIWLYSFDSKKADPYLNTIFSEASPVFSPDGKWLAYSSNEQGAPHVFVGSLAPGAEKGKKHVGVGYDPKWPISTDKLYYRSYDSIMAVSVATGPRFQLLERPEMIYKGLGIVNYDVHPKDKKLLVVKNSEGYEDRRQIRVVLNWFEELNRLLVQRKR